MIDLISVDKCAVTAFRLCEEVKCEGFEWSHVMIIWWSPLSYRLSRRVLRPGLKLRLLPSGSTVLPSPDSLWSRIHDLLWPSWNPSREHGPSSRSTPPLQWDTMLQWDDIASPRGLPQPRAQRTHLHPQHLWHVRLHSTLHIPELSQCQWIQQSVLRDERGNSVVANNRLNQDTNTRKRLFMCDFIATKFLFSYLLTLSIYLFIRLLIYLMYLSI